MENQPATASKERIAERQALLRRFRGRLVQHDAEVVEHWRDASPAAHAAAMIELSEFAAMVVAHTGYGKNPDEMFPGFPTARLQQGAGKAPSA